MGGVILAPVTGNGGQLAFSRLGGVVLETHILCVSAGQEIFNGLDFLAFGSALEGLFGRGLDVILDFHACFTPYAKMGSGAAMVSIYNRSSVPGIGSYRLTVRGSLAHFSRSCPIAERIAEQARVTNFTC